MLIIQIALGILAGWILIQLLQVISSNRDELNSKIKTGLHKSKDVLQKTNKNIVDAWNEEGDYSSKPPEIKKTQSATPPIVDIDLPETEFERLTSSEIIILTISAILWLVVFGFIIQ